VWLYVERVKLQSLTSSESREYCSEIIWAQEIFLIIINVENSCAAQYFLWKP